MDYIYTTGERVRIVRTGKTWDTPYRTGLTKGDRGTVIAIMDSMGKPYPVIWADADGPVPTSITTKEMTKLMTCYEYVEPFSHLEQLAEAANE